MGLCLLCMFYINSLRQLPYLITLNPPYQQWYPSHRYNLSWPPQPPYINNCHWGMQAAAEIVFVSHFKKQLSNLFQSQS